jgi:hypothetical protein
MSREELTRPSTSRTRYGQAIKSVMEVNILVTYCNKHGNEQFPVKLRNVDVIPASHYNLISITRLIEEGHKLSGNKNKGITLKKNGCVIAFDVRVETPKGLLWCVHIKRNDCNGKVAAGSSNNQPVAMSMKAKRS